MFRSMKPSIEAPALIELVVERLAASYIFPEVSTRAADRLHAGLEQGAYELAVGRELCERISADLFAASNDKHLRLLWHETIEDSCDEAQLIAALREQIRLENHGVRRVEHLPGNIGLIELTIIPEAATGGSTLAAAMHLVEHAQALILDLRPTRGGSPDGVVFLASCDVLQETRVHTPSHLSGSGC
jgi:C-terminal processing protease CtpA/Prc